MPITSFNDLRNPYSVGQPTTQNGVDTGTGYAIIVRLQSMEFYDFDLGTYVTATPTDLINGVEIQNWSGVVTMGNGVPSDPSFTAFLSSDDYLNSDLNQIAASPLMWQVGMKFTYRYENAAMTAANQLCFFSWEVIEVVDEATYNAGAGAPTGLFISEATYGEIPVGTITASSVDPNSNGASTVYEYFNVPTNQGLPVNSTPGYQLDSAGTMLGNSLTAIQITPQTPLYSQVPPGEHIWGWYSCGFYIGTYWGCVGAENAITRSCRNPDALNYDPSTTNYFASYTTLPMYTYQEDCAGDQFTPIIVGPSAFLDFGNEDCCIFADGSGSGDGSSGCDPADLGIICGCISTPMAANFCPGCTQDCNGVAISSGGTAASCCTFYHKWKYCGGHGTYATWITPQYINFVGSPTDSTAANTPDTNNSFMQYLYDLPG